MTKQLRLQTGFPNLDTLLGGGLVRGSTLLLGGDPGVGKTTLAMQFAVAAERQRAKSIFCSGEQSEGDLRALLARVGGKTKLIELVADANVYAITGRGVLSPLVIFDTIQTAYIDDVASAVGTQSQIMAVANYLTSFAKKEGVAVVLLTHMTKDGQLACPRAVEHLVDVVGRLDHVEVAEGMRPTVARALSVSKSRYAAPAPEALLTVAPDGSLRVRE